MNEVTQDHQPKPGRIAFVCTHKDHKGILYRRFVKPDDDLPECPFHGRMELQKNAPYRGIPIPVAV